MHYFAPTAEEGHLVRWRAADIRPPSADRDVAYLIAPSLAATFSKAFSCKSGRLQSDTWGQDRSKAHRRILSRRPNPSQDVFMDGAAVAAAAAALPLVLNVTTD